MWIYSQEDPMDLMHAKAEFEAGRLNEAAAEPSEQGDGWRLLLHTETGETLVLTDHAGLELLYHSLDHATEVAREIGFNSLRVEEHF
ncbi:MAG: thymidylate kinase [Gammaproteobacteria bacterium]|nr:thymidylate kinase [Gammaproteobacteria bacterium]